MNGIDAIRGVISGIHSINPALGDLLHVMAKAVPKEERQPPRYDEVPSPLLPFYETYIRGNEYQFYKSLAKRILQQIPTNYWYSIVYPLLYTIFSNPRSPSISLPLVYHLDMGLKYINKQRVPLIIPLRKIQGNVTAKDLFSGNHDPLNHTARTVKPEQVNVPPQTSNQNWKAILEVTSNDDNALYEALNRYALYFYLEGKLTWPSVSLRISPSAIKGYVFVTDDIDNIEEITGTIQARPSFSVLKPIIDSTVKEYALFGFQMTVGEENIDIHLPAQGLEVAWNDYDLHALSTALLPVEDTGGKIINPPTPVVTVMTKPNQIEPLRLRLTNLLDLTTDRNTINRFLNAIQTISPLIEKQTRTPNHTLRTLTIISV